MLFHVFAQQRKDSLLNPLYLCTANHLAHRQAVASYRASLGCIKHKTRRSSDILKVISWSWNVAMTSDSHVRSVFCKLADQARAEEELQAYSIYLHGTLCPGFIGWISVVLQGDEEHAGVKSFSVLLEGIVVWLLNVQPKLSIINILHTWTL